MHLIHCKPPAILFVYKPVAKAREVFISIYCFHNNLNPIWSESKNFMGFISTSEKFHSSLDFSILIHINCLQFFLLVYSVSMWKYSSASILLHIFITIQCIKIWQGLPALPCASPCSTFITIQCVKIWHRLPILRCTSSCSTFITIQCSKCQIPTWVPSARWSHGTVLASRTCVVISATATTTWIVTPAAVAPVHRNKATSD